MGYQQNNPIKPNPIQTFEAETYRMMVCAVYEKMNLTLIPSDTDLKKKIEVKATELTSIVMERADSIMQEQP